MAAIKETEPVSICIQAPDTTKRETQPIRFGLLVVSSNSPGQITVGWTTYIPESVNKTFSHFNIVVTTFKPKTYTNIWNFRTQYMLYLNKENTKIVPDSPKSWKLTMNINSHIQRSTIPMFFKIMSYVRSNVFIIEN